MGVLIKTVWLASAVLSLFASTANASDPLLSLKNLERERAAFLDKALSQRDDKEQQFNESQAKLRQLSDMERMVIRDDRLVEQNSSLVSNAFSQFELTFLVHASAESESTVLSHWLEEVGYSNKAILTASPGYRR
ncbi:MAG: hypothetical protein AAGJ37_08400 [Pseudomonadota bacterium]